MPSHVFPEIVLQSPDNLIVVVSDGLKLPVEFGQFDVVVHCRLVDFHNFNATSKMDFLMNPAFSFMPDSENAASKRTFSSFVNLMP